MRRSSETIFGVGFDCMFMSVCILSKRVFAVATSSKNCGRNLWFIGRSGQAGRKNAFAAPVVVLKEVFSTKFLSVSCFKSGQPE